MLVAAEAKWWLLRRLCGSCCGGYVVVLTNNNATSWPILQAEAFRFSAKMKFQNGGLNIIFTFHLLFVEQIETELHPLGKYIIKKNKH